MSQLGESVIIPRTQKREATGLSKSKNESRVPDSQSGANPATPQPPRGSAALEATDAVPSKSPSPPLVTGHMVGLEKPAF